MGDVDVNNVNDVVVNNVNDVDNFNNVININDSNNDNMLVINSYSQILALTMSMNNFNASINLSILLLSQ